MHCVVEECTAPVYIKKYQLCRLHYYRQYNNKPLTPTPRVLREPKPKKILCAFGGCTYPVVDTLYCDKHMWNITGLKYCTYCKELLPVDRFSLQASGKKKLRSQCSTCREALNKGSRDRSRVRHSTDPDKRRAHKNRSLVSTYHITLDQFCDILYTQQSGKCAFQLCDKVSDSLEDLLVSRDSFWHVDHDHRCCPGTGSCGNCIRGVLCPGCNNLFASFWEDEKNREAALSYIDRLV